MTSRCRSRRLQSIACFTLNAPSPPTRALLCTCIPGSQKLSYMDTVCARRPLRGKGLRLWREMYFEVIAEEQERFTSGATCLFLFSFNIRCAICQLSSDERKHNRTHNSIYGQGCFIICIAFFILIVSCRLQILNQRLRSDPTVGEDKHGAQAAIQIRCTTAV